jgi:hypothetical protein
MVQRIAQKYTMEIATRLVSAILLVCALGYMAPSAKAQQPTITVRSNVQVSVAHAKVSHGEVLIAADPTDPNRLIGCSMVVADPLNKRVVGGITYLSTDAGATWVPTLEVDDDDTSDPSCGFGPDGIAYSVFLAHQYGLVYRSQDGGKTWGTPVHIDGEDREYLTVDMTGSKFNGRIYINAMGALRLLDPPLEPANNVAFSPLETSFSVHRSLDGGRTFEPARKRPSLPPHWIVGMGNGVVLSDGTYAAVFGEQRERIGLNQRPPFISPNASLKIISTSDGGETYSSPTTISGWYMNYAGSTSSNMPVIAVDHSSGPFKDRLYVVWPDFRSGRGEILLSYSKDKGKTWSAPRVINDDRPWPPPDRGPDDIMPTIEVNKNGVVGVAWYDRRDNPRNYGWWVRFAASTDGGETFTPSVRVSTKAATINLDGRIGLRAYAGSWNGNLRVDLGFGSFDFNGGHTAGIAADASGSFHPFWIDNRTGVQQVWTAAVSVDGEAIVNSSKQLAELEDASSRVSLYLKDANFDRETGLLTVFAYLRNTSSDVLRLPVFLRVLTFNSKLGDPQIQNADNQEDREGALWDFSRLVPGGGLPPGATTSPKALRFRISNIDWQRQPFSADDLKGFITFEAKVLVHH